jgi:hypothetical protein
LDKDIEDERALASSQERSFNPRLVWYLHLRHAPVLAHAAVALLSVAGSEAAVERSFSAQGDVHSDRRNRLADVTVEAEMFIKFNERTVRRMEEWESSMKEAKGRRRKRQQTEAPPRGREMDEGYEEDEDTQSIAGLFMRPERKQSAVEVQDEKEEVHCHPQVVIPAAIITVPPPPAADEVQRFIEEYVRKYGIHSKFRWRDYHIQQLETAGLGWQPQPMRDTVDVLKRKIMAWVRGQTEQEAEVADVADIE